MHRFASWALVVAATALCGCPKKTTPAVNGATETAPADAKPDDAPAAKSGDPYAEVKVGQVYVWTRDMDASGKTTEEVEIKHKEADHLATTSTRKFLNPPAVTTGPETKMPFVAMTPPDFEAKAIAAMAVRSETLTIGGIKFDCFVTEANDRANAGKKTQVWRCMTKYPFTIKQLDGTGKVRFELTDVRQR